MAGLSTEGVRRAKETPPSLVAYPRFLLLLPSVYSAHSHRNRVVPPVREESTSIASFACLGLPNDFGRHTTYVHAPYLSMRMRVLLIDSLLDSQIVLQIDSHKSIPYSIHKSFCKSIHKSILYSIHKSSILYSIHKSFCKSNLYSIYKSFCKSIQ